MKYELKNIKTADIRKVLTANFLQNFITVAFKPVGAGSWLYDVFGDGGTHYFLKISNSIDGSTGNMGKVLSYISDVSGLETVNITATTDGSFVFDLKGYKCFLYKYIDGEVVENKNLTPEEWFKIGKELGFLHKISLPKKLQKEIYQEEFVQFRARAEKIINTVKNENLKGETRQALAKLILKHFKNVAGFFEKTKEMGKELKGRPFVVTHGDAHPWSILRSGYKFRFIDWDGIGMALPERDLMHYFNKKQWKCIVDGYREILPGFTVNEKAIIY